MAFNLLVELGPNQSNWKKINEEARIYLVEGIEIFPIPAFPNSNRNYIGISIVLIDAQVKSSLREIVIYFLKEGNKIFELYDFNEFQPTNIDFLISKFLGGGLK